MDFNAQDVFTYDSVFWDAAGAFPYHEAQMEMLLPMRPASNPWVGQENPNPYPVGSWDPVSSVPEQPSTMLQDRAVTQSLSATQRTFGQPVSVIISNGTLGQFEKVLNVTRTVGPSEDDWERYRPMIKDLYAKNTLKDVIDIMKRDHGFKASTKMYKARINKWRIDKNVKSEEMKTIVRKQAQRERAGKDSAFRIRDSQVSKSKIDRFLRKTAAGLVSEGQALRLRARTPPGLICYTPLASPLATPRDLEIPECIATMIHVYVGGSFDNKTLQITRHQGCISTKSTNRSIYGLSDAIGYAVSELEKGEPNRAWMALNMAMSYVKRIISEDHPDTLGTLAMLILNFFLPHRLLDIASTILKHFSAMSAAIMPQEHPYNQIFPRFIALDIPHLKHALKIAQKSQLDCFAQRAGRFNRTTVWMQLDFLRTSEINAEEATQSLLALLQELERTLDINDEICLNVRLETACHYYEKGDWRDAALVARPIIAIAAQREDMLPEYIISAHNILARVHFMLSEMDAAEENMRKAIRIAADEYGREDHYVLTLMSKLEFWLEEWGRLEEAAEVRRQMDDAADSQHERFSREEEERWQALYPGQTFDVNFGQDSSS